MCARGASKLPLSVGSGQSRRDRAVPSSDPSERSLHCSEQACCQDWREEPTGLTGWGAQVFALLRLAVSLPRGSDGLSQQVLQKVLDDDVPPIVPFGEEKTVALEGLCKNESGQVSRGNGQSCCQVYRERGVRVAKRRLALPCCVKAGESAAGTLTPRDRWQFPPYTASSYEPAGPLACFPTTVQ